MPGQIVIINGTSGSGKSTTAELFQKRADDYWLLYGIDHFLAGTQPAHYGHHGPKSREGIHAEPADPADPDGPLKWVLGPRGVQAFAALHEWLAASSRVGCNIVFDHLLMTQTPVLADCAWRLDGLPVLLVTLKPPFEVLEKRVAERQMDKKIPVDLLLTQLKQAGVKVDSEKSPVTAADKAALLGHLGKAGTAAAGSEPRRITLKRKETTELRLGGGRGAPSKTVSIEVRKRRTYVKAGTEGQESAADAAAAAKEEAEHQAAARAAAEAEVDQVEPEGPPSGLGCQLRTLASHTESRISTPER